MAEQKRKEERISFQERDKAPGSPDGQDTIRIHEDEADTLYRKDYKQRYHLDRGRRALVIMGVLLVVVYFLCILLPNGMDSNNVHISLAWWMEILRQNVGDFAVLLSGGTPDYMGLIAVRFLIVAAVGAALSVSGAVYQGTFRNGLVSPTTLGVQTGGVVGGSIYIMFFMTEYTSITYAEMQSMYTGWNAWKRYEESIFILAGCFAAVFFVMFMARIIGRGRMSTVGLILTGMVFSSVASGITGLVQYRLMLYDPYGARTYALRYMMTGTFDDVTTAVHLVVIGVPVLIGLFLVIILAPKLNVVAFGDEEAQALGINIRQLRGILVAISTVLTAVVITFCGSIGFVGFLVPHITRRFIGPDNRYLIPGSAMVGALLMMVVYYVGTLINYASNINFLTSLIGGVVFLIMLVRFRGSSNADWA